VLLAGIVDQDIEPAEGVDYLLHGAEAEIAAAEVAGDADGAAALGLDELLRVRRILMLVEVEDGDIRAFAGEQHGDRAADPAVAAGDDRDLVLQPVGAGIARLPLGLGVELMLVAGSAASSRVGGSIVSAMALLLGGDARAFLAEGLDRDWFCWSCGGAFSTGVVPSLPVTKLSRLPSLGSSDILLFWFCSSCLSRGRAGSCSFDYPSLMVTPRRDGLRSTAAGPLAARQRATMVGKSKSVLRRARRRWRPRTRRTLSSSVRRNATCWQDAPPRAPMMAIDVGTRTHELEPR
jgi:hypothetical protein